MNHTNPRPLLLQRAIHSILESSFKKFLIYLITLFLFVGSIYMVSSEIVKAKMLPGKDSDTFSLYVDLPTGSSVQKTKEVTTCISKELMKEDAIVSSSVFLGEGLPLDFAGMVKGSAMKSAQNEAEMMINLKRADHRSEQSYNIVHRIRPIVQNRCSMNGASIKFIEPPAGPPTLADVVAEITGGKSFESRRYFANEVANILREQNTLVDIDVLADDTTYEYSLILNNNKIIESGIGLEQVKKMLYIAFEGSDIGVINKRNAENQIKIFLRLDDSRLLKNVAIEDISDKLKDLKLMNPMGLMIPMNNFVEIKKIKRIATINSKNLQNMINVIATTDKDSQIYPLLDARSDMLEKLSQKYEVVKTNMLNLSFKDKKTSETFSLAWDGELKVTIDTFIELGGAFIGALILIYFLMVIYYKRFAIAGAIVLSSFLSLIGVIIGHYVMDLITSDTFYLTATSLIGFIGLIGINSRNSLLIIDFAEQLMNENKMNAVKAISIATSTRAKPILLTVLAIVFASSLLAGDAVFGGLGVALIGGTLFAYLVSLFFVPMAILNSLKKNENNLSFSTSKTKIR
ncbi:Acriflavin resistance protein [hydrothermal vent metagenome]|uniref:Acriflavin resistance protein n=1 Tax=hydrothermal vent metagenome TaxID=652676 RepID=A0A3B1E6F7_9ZZZZ